MRRLYLDLDGVMADFDAGFTKLFGMHNRDFRALHGENADDVMWPVINGHDSFFADLPLMEGGINFLRLSWELHLPQPVILTACPKSNYAHVALQKRQWVRRHLGNLTVLPVCGGAAKALFMHAPGDVLIDDHRRNIEAWQRHGGIGVLHRTWDKTMAETLAAFGKVVTTCPA